jgi:DNA-binding transcriptional LysR family regulator
MVSYINQLRVFYTVAKFKSLTRAARELNVTPPAISRQLKTFEEMLELKLVYLDGKSIRLTKIGSEIYKRSLDVFQKLEELDHYIQDLVSVKTGSLRVGFPPSIAKSLMAPLIESFRKEYPDLKITLDQASSAELIARIVERKTDIAIVGRVPNEHEDKLEIIKSKKRGPLAFISSPSYAIADAISIKEVAQQSLIFPQEGSATRAAILEFFKQFDLKPTIILESSSIDVLKEMVVQGKGLAFITRIAVHYELENKTLKAVRILEGEPEIERWFIYLKDRTLSPAAQAFLRVIEEINDIETKLMAGKS